MNQTISYTLHSSFSQSRYEFLIIGDLMMLVVEILCSTISYLYALKEGEETIEYLIHY